MRLQADDLTVVRGGRRVLSGLSLALGPGGGIAVTGPNGAGKSTLLRVIAGLVTAQSGRVRFLDDGGTELPDAPPGARLHYVGHLDAVKPQLTVTETLHAHAQLMGAGPRKVAPALERLAISHLARLPGLYLSAGQRRRVALARLLLVPRPLWLLDEPTAGLDAAGEIVLDALVREHLAAGGLAAAATHLRLPALTQVLPLAQVRAA